MQNFSYKKDIVTKTSIGIIIIKLNNTQPEVLLVHKRCTYAFNEFIFGNYKSYTKIETILEQMTTEELLDIWSLNFEQMWYRYCLDVNKQDVFYNKKYTKFQFTFMQDGGIRLRKLVENTTSRGVLLWEVPKGRKANNKESDINCAIREVEEETGIKKCQYTLIPNAKRKVSFISCGVKYVCIYHIAFANESLSRINLEYKLLKNLKSLNRIQEVFEIKWYNIHNLRLFDLAAGKKWLESLISPAFRLILNIKRKG